MGKTRRGRKRLLSEEQEQQPSSSGKGAEGDWESEGRPEFVTLHNLGNTCYLNSVVQALRWTDRLFGALQQLNNRMSQFFADNRQLFESSDAAALLEKMEQRFLLCRELYLVFERCSLLENLPDEMELENAKFRLRCKRLKEFISLVYPMFEGSEQQDAQEAFSVIVDSVNSVEQFLTEAGHPATVTGDTSLLATPFEGILKVVIRCRQCEEMSERRERCVAIGVSMAGGRTRSDHEDEEDEEVVKEEDSDWLLEMFSVPQSLTGPDKYQCPHCLTRCEATQTYDVEKLPDVLVFHLKRFSEWITVGVRSEQNKYVPLLASPRKPFDVGRLCLTEKTTGATDGDRKIMGRIKCALPSCRRRRREMAESKKSKSGKVACEDKNHEYHLYAVVIHSGASLHSGHYYAYVVARQWSNKDDDQICQWVKFNDSSYEKVTGQQLKKALRNSTATPYMLFYRRQSLA